jgi:hypothetical protein
MFAPAVTRPLAFTTNAEYVPAEAPEAANVRAIVPVPVPVASPVNVNGPPLPGRTPAEVTSPFVLTMTELYVPAVTPELARVVAIVTLELPSNNVEPVISPEYAIVLGVDNLSEELAAYGMIRIDFAGEPCAIAQKAVLSPAIQTI